MKKTYLLTCMIFILSYILLTGCSKDEEDCRNPLHMPPKMLIRVSVWYGRQALSTS